MPLDPSTVCIMLETKTKSIPVERISEIHILFCREKIILLYILMLLCLFYFCGYTFIDKNY